MDAFTKQLWFIRFAYFCYCAGQAVLLPYLSLYMKQCGISTHEAAIMASMTPVVSLVTKPIFGIIADRARIHKALVIFCMVTNAVLFGLLNFIPSRINVDAAVVNGSESNLTTQQNLTNVGVTSSDVHASLDDSVFVYWLVLRTLAFAFQYPACSLLDAATYMVLDPHRDAFGSCRFIGSLGYCIASLVTAVILYLVGSDTEIHFPTVILIYSVLSVGCCVAVALFRYSDTFRERRARAGSGKRTRRLLRDVRKQVCSVEMCMLLVFLCCFGYSSGMWNCYMYWVFNDLGVTTLNLGAALALSSLCEIVVVRFTGKLVKLISEPGCLIVISFLDALEFLGYAFIKQPWLLLVVQPLSGANFGMNVVAHSMYVTRLSSAVTIAVMQGIASCVFIGLGQTASALLGGYLYVSYGSFTLIISCVIVNTACMFVYILVYIFFIRPKYNKKKHAKSDASAMDEAEGDKKAEELAQNGENCLEPLKT